MFPFLVLMTLSDPSVEQLDLTALIRQLAAAKDPTDRLELVRKIAGSKSPKAIATLSLELGEEKNAEAVRLAALSGLEMLKHPDASDAIALSALQSDSVVVRAQAIEAIGRLRIREFIPACTRGLIHSQPSIRCSAIKALISFDDMALAARTLPALKDRDESVQLAARVGLDQFTGKLALFLLCIGR